MSVSRETVVVASSGRDRDLLRPLAEWLAPRATALGMTTFADPPSFLTNMMLPALALRGWPVAADITSLVELGPGSGGLGLAFAALYPKATVALVDRREKVTSFLDLAAHALALPNVRVRCMEADTADEAPDLVALRAFDRPARALQLASRWAGVAIGAWHSPGADYGTPPPGFSLGPTVQVVGCTVMTTFFERSAQILPPEGLDG